MTSTPEAMQVLLTYSWPGNVRELKNAMEYVTATAPDDRVEPYDLPEQLGARTSGAHSALPGQLGGAPPGAAPPLELLPFPVETEAVFRPISEELRELERKRMA